MIEIEPSLQRFRELGESQRVVSVWTRVSADDLTAVGLYAQLCGTRDGTFLFESAEQGVWSRYSFVGVHTQTALIGSGEHSHWIGRPIAGLPSGGRPLEVLAQSLQLLATPRTPELPPFVSGMVGYLGYDMVRQVEKLADTNVNDLGVPEMIMAVVSDLAVLDHHKAEVWLIANAINFDDSLSGIDQAYDDARDRVVAMATQLTQPRPVLSSVQTQPVDLPVQRERSAAEFEAIVEEAKQRIFAGDIFQVVASQRYQVPTQADALDVYRQLRVLNPSPYLFLLRLSDGAQRFSVVGSSPEALVSVKDQMATMHPIAGTRPRGTSVQADLALEHDLLSDEKERAEHLMLVDLGRNDLGRVCEPGTVTVTEFMAVHRYSTVMHLEATVTGKVSPGRSALDVTMACFPAGTLSGAPKVSAMQIIDELEISRRGVYGGVVGYFDFDGDADVAIAIRSGLLKDGVAYVQAGAGIVADSVPVNEDQEAFNKARSVLTAINRAASMQKLSDGLSSLETGIEKESK